MSFGFMILYLPNQTLRFEPCHLVSHSGRPATAIASVRPPTAPWAAYFPAPAPSERCHRSLARRLELWCAAAAERRYLASLRSGLWDLLANDYAATYLDASFVAAISARR